MSNVNHAIEPILAGHPVIPVVTVSDPDNAVALGRALLDGGIDIIEITLRSDAALAAIRAVADALPQMTVGAGTVRNKASLDASIAAGAAFAVSPGMTPVLLDAARHCELPFLPAGTTAGEIMSLLDAGFTTVKFFPAAAMGGTAALAALAGPLPEARFCPSGGVNGDNFVDYLRLGNVVSVSGSWLAPAAAVTDENWGEITRRAAEALGRIP